MLMVLALACLCLAGSVAQAGMPEGRGSPGPLHSLFAPAGPSDDLGLPANTPNAFNPPKESSLECFFSAGAMALQRERMGQAALAINTTTGVTAMEFDDIAQNFNLGPRGALGLVSGSTAFEISGFYLPRHDSALTNLDPGLQTMFTNTAGPLGAPALLRTTLTTTLGSLEAAVSSWSPTWNGPQWLVGCRYLDLQERLAILGADAGGNQETYVSRTFNRLVGPTLGVEYGIPVGSSAAFSVAGKGTWAWNLVSADVALINNGATTFADANNRTIFSQVYEIAFYADIWLADPVHLRLGCQALWALHVAEAVKQINFDAQAPGLQNNQGSILYWGPMAELQIVW